MSIIVKDFTMLGTTVPEPSRTDDNRLYVCSAGWHPDLGLIRIYPLGRRAAPRRWSVSTVEIERNSKDSRGESWRLVGDRTSTSINSQFSITGETTAMQKRSLLDAYDAKRLPRSIAEANDRRASLALIRPDGLNFELEHNAASPDSPQLRLFSDGLPEPLGAKRFPHIPRLRFNDGTSHRLMLRDWGAYEWMRKAPDRVSDLEDNLHLSDRSVLLVGNLNHQRNAWVVISVLNINSAQLTLGVAS